MPCTDACPGAARHAAAAHPTVQCVHTLRHLHDQLEAVFAGGLVERLALAVHSDTHTLFVNADTIDAVLAVHLRDVLGHPDAPSLSAVMSTKTIHAGGLSLLDIANLPGVTTIFVSAPQDMALDTLDAIDHFVDLQVFDFVCRTTRARKRNGTTLPKSLTAPIDILHAASKTHGAAIYNAFTRGGVSQRATLLKAHLALPAYEMLTKQLLTTTRRMAIYHSKEVTNYSSTEAVYTRDPTATVAPFCLPVPTNEDVSRRYLTKERTQARTQTQTTKVCRVAASAPAFTGRHHRARPAATRTPSVVSCLRRSARRATPSTPPSLHTLGALGGMGGLGTFSAFGSIGPTAGPSAGRAVDRPTPRPPSVARTPSPKNIDSLCRRLTALRPAAAPLSWSLFAL